MMTILIVRSYVLQYVVLCDDPLDSRLKSKNCRKKHALNDSCDNN